MDTLPLLSEDLVNDLDKHFPPVTPRDVRDTDAKGLVFKAGSREVVEFLQMVLARTQEAAFDVHVNTQSSTPSE